ncbi:MAG TPA: hypothetical protein VFZ73_18925 [Gemmatimonadaceae bacterium]
MLRFFRWYQFLVPLALFPLSYVLWLRRYDGEHALVWLALSLPVVSAYVIPGLGTNWLGLWEFNTRFRVGRYRPHHGFVFGTATSLFGLLCVPEAAPGFNPGDCLNTALIAGSVIGFWNWLYDIHAIKSGFIVIHTRPAAEGQPAEVVATSHAPVYFGVLGATYGVFLYLIDALAAASERGTFLAIAVAGNLACMVFPVVAYVLWSYLTLGESGLKAYRFPGGRHERERRVAEPVPVGRMRVSRADRLVAER